MVQYTDCLIDTSTEIYLAKTYYRYDYQEDTPDRPALTSLRNLINEPELFHELLFGRQSYIAWMAIDSLVDIKWSKNPQLKPLLQNAVNEAVRLKTPDLSLETWAGRYLSPRDELMMKRLRRVEGTCSMDNSPRLHAADICRLAAESASWEVFLRSHLDIMNDRFDRATDGNYAWGRRGTYIHELEVLGINVPELLLGTALRIENPANNHYYGSVTRLGRALAESNQVETIESQLRQYIADPTLDDFNRLVFSYLYASIAWYKPPSIKDETFEAKKVRVLAEAKSVNALLPDYLQE
jgi:hypothetical protein